MPIDVALAACRVHAQRGGDPTTFRWATVRLAWHLQRRAEWFAARVLLNEIPDDEHDAASLRSLASVEDSLGEWKSARSLLERASAMMEEAAQEYGRDRGRALIERAFAEGKAEGTGEAGTAP